MSKRMIDADVLLEWINKKAYGGLNNIGWGMLEADKLKYFISELSTPTLAPQESTLSAPDWQVNDEVVSVGTFFKVSEINQKTVVLEGVNMQVTLCTRDGYINLDELRRKR